MKFLLLVGILLAACMAVTVLGGVVDNNYKYYDDFKRVIIT